LEGKCRDVLQSQWFLEQEISVPGNQAAVKEFVHVVMMWYIIESNIHRLKSEILASRQKEKKKKKHSIWRGGCAAQPLFRLCGL
jgi:hypothetical protein